MEAVLAVTTTAKSPLAVSAVAVAAVTISATATRATMGMSIAMTSCLLDLLHIASTQLCLWPSLTTPAAPTSGPPSSTPRWRQGRWTRWWRRPGWGRPTPGPILGETTRVFPSSPSSLQGPAQICCQESGSTSARLIWMRRSSNNCCQYLYFRISKIKKMVEGWIKLIIKLG